MPDDPPDLPSLLERARAGDAAARVALFAAYRDRLRQMLRLRLDPRLGGRLDVSDVLQEAYLDFERRLPEFTAEAAVPFYVWLRQLAGQRLTDLHRRHLGTQARDAGREISLYQGPLPEASSAALAAQLVGRLTTASQAAQRAEMQLRVQQALNDLEPLDREVLTLRHFEELSNEETARVLGLSKTAASNRYVRALRRMKEALAGAPGLGEP